MKPESPWLKVELHQVAEIQTGLAKGKKVDAESAVEVLYLRVANVQDGYVDLHEMKTIAVERSSIERYALRVGDVLFTEGGDPDKLGRGCVWRGEISPCLHQNHVFVARPDQSRLLPDFLAQYAGSSAGKAYFASCAKQTTNLASINSTQLKAFPIPLPPLFEQRKIATILSSVDDAIGKTQAVINQLEVVKKGMLEEFVTQGVPGRHRDFSKTVMGRLPVSWSVVSLGELAELVTSGSRGWARYYSDEGDLFIRITNLSRASIHPDFTDAQYVSLPEGAEEGMRTSVRPGDLLVSITADLGIVGVVPGGIGRAHVNQHIALVRLRGEVLGEFAAYALASVRGQKELWRLNDSGAKAGLNLSSIRRCHIPLPPIQEQKEIVDSINAVQDRIERERQFLFQVREVKTGLMDSLLSGRVRVRPANQEAA